MTGRGGYREKWGFAAVFALVLAAGWLVYAPGLHGAFLLDDFPNLEPLAYIAPPLTGEGLVSFVFSDVSGVSGRLLALASFALQYRAWPGDPAAFKTVNLLIHLGNALLLCAVFWRAGRLAGLPARRARATALLAAALWLLHPLHVSTVLYVVQRMTEIAVFFTLAGLLAYLHGRERLASSARQGYAWMLAGIALGSALALLGKEIGVLLPLYALVMEKTLFAETARPAHWRVGEKLLLVAPLVLVAGYIAWHGAAWLAGYRLRDFTPGERLLTEARVLCDYLALALWPRPAALGLFHDDYVVSRGLLAPPQTLAAVLFLAALAGSALLWRRRWRFFGFGVLWFLAGHLLEASFLPLEPYFEHRNYLPLAGVLYALVQTAWEAGAKARATAVLPALRLAGALALAGFAFLTWREAVLWGNPPLQAATWASEHPASIRAQENWAGLLAASGHFQLAAERFAALAEGPLRDAPAYLSWLRAACDDPRVALPDTARLLAALRGAKFSNAPFSTLEELVEARARGACRRLDRNTVLDVFAALRANPAFASRRAPLYGLEGRFLMAEKDWQGAIAAFEAEQSLAPDGEAALLQARCALQRGEVARARAYLARAAQANRARGFKGRRLAGEIALEANLADQLEAHLDTQKGKR